MILAQLELAKLEDIFPQLIFLIFILAPLLKRIFGGKEDDVADPKRRTPPSRTRGSARQGAPPSGKPKGMPVSWQDLMRGMGSEPPPAAPAPPASSGSAEAVTRVPAKRSQDRRQEQPIGLEIAPLGGDNLGPLPTEDELEERGGAVDRRDVATLPAPPATFASPILAPTRSSVGEETLVERLDAELASRRSRKPAVAALRDGWRPAQGDWKGAIVIAEVLGQPLSERTGGAYPGPPLARRRR